MTPKVWNGWKLICEEFGFFRLLSLLFWDRRILFTEWTFRLNWCINDVNDVNGYEIFKHGEWPLDREGCNILQFQCQSFGPESTSQHLVVWFGQRQLERSSKSNLLYTTYAMVSDIWQRIDMGGSMSKFYISLQIDHSRKFMTSNVPRWYVCGRVHLEAELCEDVLWLSLVFVTRDCEPRAATWRQVAHFCHLLTVVTLMDEEMKIFRLKFSEHSRHSTTCALNFSRYSFASDVWSYGVTIYEAAMLVPPFRGANICQAGIKVDQSFSKSLGKKNTCRIMSKNSRSMTLQFIAVRS